MTSEMIPNDALLTPQQAAEVLQTNVTRLKEMRKHTWTGKRPKSVRVGHRTIRYRMSDLQAYIAEL